MSEKNGIPGSVVITIDGEARIFVRATDNVAPEQLAKVAVALLKIVKSQGKKEVFDDAIQSLSKECDCVHCKERRVMEGIVKQVDPKLN
ncbi:MAG: hypothetical protein WAQ28_02070 [Bacteroidia bacterium]